MSYRGINSLNHSTVMVDHTHNVISEAEAIQASAVDMDTGMRGFLLNIDKVLTTDEINEVLSVAAAEPPAVTAT